MATIETAVAKATTKKVREDFKQWADWCEYRKQRALKRAARATAQAQTWEQLKGGEHLLKAIKLTRQLARMEAKLAKAKADLAATQPKQ